MTSDTFLEKLQKLKDGGITASKMRWDDERKAATLFFKGLSPAQEYDQHIKKRKEALEKYGEIE